MLAALIECEAGGESYSRNGGSRSGCSKPCQQRFFPNSVSGVIYQSGQFTPVATGTFQSVLARGARSDCYAAAQAALAGESPVGGCCISTAATAAEFRSDISIFIKNRRGTFARG